VFREWNSYFFSVFREWISYFFFVFREWWAWLDYDHDFELHMLTLFFLWVRLHLPFSKRLQIRFRSSLNAFLSRRRFLQQLPQVHDASRRIYTPPTKFLEFCASLPSLHSDSRKDSILRDVTQNLRQAVTPAACVVEVVGGRRLGTASEEIGDRCK